jgi:alkane 1-monooxygenase
VVLLAEVNYAHFRVEHVLGHHATVGTPEDPATSRKNEWVFPFIVRSVVGGFFGAWRIERRRLQKSGKPFYGNRVLHYGALQLAVNAAVLGLFGWRGLAFHLVQSVSAFTLLEVINYVEHYGLTRARHEPVRPEHSWDSAHLATNAFLFNLGFHSQHHAEPRRAFTALQASDGRYEMPLGYTGMLMLALVPPVFFRVMNPLVEKRATFR